MQMGSITRAMRALTAGLLAAGLFFATVAHGAAEDYSGRGLVFASDGTLYFEAEEGGVYMIDGLDLSDFEGVLVLVTGRVLESEASGPVLIVATVAEDEQDATGDAPRPGIAPGNQ